MTRNLKILTSIWFIFGLTILLLNDFVLKERYGNWLTGKLSDFAGLFIFLLFWTSLLPGHKHKIFLLTGLLFIVWKSPISQTLIDIWNNTGLWYVYRTVDITDLIALISLPIAFRLETISEKLATVSLTPYIPLVISAFAFMATSKGPNTCFDEATAVYHIKHFSRDSLINELQNSGLEISFIKYNNTKYDDEHSEIINLNDTISNLVVLIGDFNKVDSTVEISLGCWDYSNNSTSREIAENNLEIQRAYVKSIFEREVIEKIEKNAP